MYTVTFEILEDSIAKFAKIAKVLAANEDEATIVAGLDMYYAGFKKWKIILIEAE